MQRVWSTYLDSNGHQVERERLGAESPHLVQSFHFPMGIFSDAFDSSLTQPPSLPTLTVLDIYHHLPPHTYYRRSLLLIHLPVPLTRALQLDG
jgi:hypothetical protein